MPTKYPTSISAFIPQRRLFTSSSSSLAEAVLLPSSSSIKISVSATSSTTSQMQDPLHKRPQEEGRSSITLSSLSMQSSSTTEYNVKHFESSSSPSQHQEIMDEDKKANNEKLQLHENDQNLFCIPSSLTPVYRRMSFMTKAIIGSFALLFSTVRVTHSSSTSPWKLGLHSIMKIQTTKNIIRFLLKFISITSLSTVIVQELFHAPSRIDTLTLMKRQWFPSPLSKFSTVSTNIDTRLLENSQESITIDPMGVHYLHYKPRNHDDNDYDDNNNNISNECGVAENDTSILEQKLSSNLKNFDVVHFNHGFGASSLSWLPAIPSLVNKLQAKSAIAHDSPGFGFTDRPKPLSLFRRKNSLVPFTSAGSAALGNALLLNEIGYNEKSKNDIELNEANKQKRVALFGHSMGCATTLKMALTLPSDIEKLVVLVAPALIGSSAKSKISKVKHESKEKHANGGIIIASSMNIRSRLKAISKWLSWPFSTSLTLIRLIGIDPPLRLILKRTVGQDNFWKKGLKLAWGNPDLVSDADALRFQWPSIGLGWESGLLAFTRSRFFSICPYKGGEQKLLEDVVKLPNTSVVIIHGTKDPVVPIQSTQKIVQRLSRDYISYLELDGLGHDPFEENVDEFANLF